MFDTAGRRGRNHTGAALLGICCLRPAASGAGAEMAFDGGQEGIRGGLRRMAWHVASTGSLSLGQADGVSVINLAGSLDLVGAEATPKHPKKG
jgi:hypothetical protein